MLPTFGYDSPPSPGEETLLRLYQVVYWLGGLAIIVIQLVAFVRFAVAVKFSTFVTVLVCLVIWIPFLNLIILVIANRRALITLRDGGVPVGFFGVRLEDLPRA
jgi:hypothetical protein